MALANCKECNKEVSSQAKICPHCGARLRLPLFVKIVFGVFASLIVLIAIGSVLPASPSAPDLLKDQAFLSSHPGYIDGLKAIIVDSGYTCPAVSAAWDKVLTPRGPLIEVVCGPDDGTGNSYAKLHFAVYIEAPIAHLCSELGTGGSCS